jgi:prolipoprotein diacylglyceryltransferase
MRDANQYGVDATALRPTGVVALLGIGAIHFLQIVDTFQSTPLLGLAYAALIAACVAAAGLISVAVIIGYAFTRLVGTTFDNQDVGNWSCMLGLASLFVEAALLAISGFAMALVHTDIKYSQPAIELERELMLEGSSSVA